MQRVPQASHAHTPGLVLWTTTDALLHEQCQASTHLLARYCSAQSHFTDRGFTQTKLIRYDARHVLSVRSCSTVCCASYRSMMSGSSRVGLLALP